ncbi:MAG: hypothetical protein AAF654_13235 [Myxococcota bacterium]
MALCFAACGPSSTDQGGRCLSDADCADGATCSRGFCGNACESSDDCPAGRVCTDGACLASPSGTCTVDSECTTPPSLCQVSDGAACESGRCVYPPVECDDPEPPFCTADNQTFVQYESPGACDVTTGVCVYTERRQECPNCELACDGECSSVECADTAFGCRTQLNLSITPGGGCECTFISVAANVDCPDDDPCTSGGQCDGNGTCVSSAIADGESCVGNDDSPVDGRCLGGNCVECIDTVDCDDGNPCTTNTCDNNTCVSADRDAFACPLADGSTGICLRDVCAECATVADCDDNSNCTVDACIADPEDPNGFNRICENAPVPAGDACLNGEAGVCNGSDVAPGCFECLSVANQADGSNDRCSITGVPSPNDQCLVATCANNACSIVNRTDGSACDDLSPSTVGDMCSAGACVGCNPRECQSFVISGGQCVYSTANEGGVCNDGNAATPFDRCNAGTCVGCAPEECKTFQGVANGECIYDNLPEGTGCNDGNGATLGDRCSNGTCLGCDQDDNYSECKDMENSNGACSDIGRPSSQSCDDGRACTTGDRCNGSDCVGSPVCVGQCVFGCLEPSGQCVFRSGSCNGEPDCSGGRDRRNYQCNSSNGACQQVSVSSCGAQVCSESAGGCVPCTSASQCGSQQCCDGSCAPSCL